MRRLLIIGAGGLGREVLAWAQDAQSTRWVDWQVGGFLDANSSALEKFGVDLPIVGDPQTYQPQPNDCFLCAVGDPATKLRLCRGMRQQGGVFATLIHPTAVVGPRCRIGAGSILCPFAALTTDIVLGDFVTVNLRSSVGHDVTIGDGCTLSSYCDVTGGAQLGEGVFLGSHAVVTPRCVVGDGARVGAGSVVIRRVPERVSVFGMPAKRLDFGGDAERKAA